MKHPRTIANVLLTCFLVSAVGCATQEFRNAQNECSYEAFMQYPVNNVTSMVNMTRSIQVPSGQTNCQTYYIGNMAQTSCTQVMRTELIPYQQMVVRDTNSSPRQAAIDSCAQNTCYRKFGNGECK
jgi:hypothetical protein